MSDNVVDVNEIKYFIDTELEKKTGNITIDFIDAGWRQGFQIQPEHPVGGNGGSCGGSCSC